MHELKYVSALRQYISREGLTDSEWEVVKEEVEKKINELFSEKDDDVRCYFLWGQEEAYWTAMYKFAQELGVAYPYDAKETLELWDKLCYVSHWWAPFRGVCFCSERPTYSCRAFDKPLHREDGPVIEYADGWKVWHLNGVSVSEEIVMTPASELDANLLLEETNAEVRREIVRKIGIERVLRDLNAEVIDRKTSRELGIGSEMPSPPDLTYELLLLDLRDGRKRPYLKMQNASHPELIHVEGVGPECNTVEQALNFRESSEERPGIIT